MKRVIAKAEDECRFDDDCAGAPPEAMCEPCKRREAKAIMTAKATVKGED